MAVAEEGLQVSVEREVLVVRPWSCSRGVRAAYNDSSMLTARLHTMSLCFVFERQAVDGGYAVFMMFMMFLGRGNRWREG